VTSFHRVRPGYARNRVDRSTTSGHASERGDRGRRGALLGVRVVLPVAIALAGVILMTVGAGSVAALGALLVGIAGLVVLVNVLARMSISSQSDRDREARARREFQRSGRWPRGAR
jgi:hypothetical protein